jgi:hypothetical protein
MMTTVPATATMTMMATTMTTMATMATTMTKESVEPL